MMTVTTAEAYRPPTLADRPDLTPDEMGRRFLKMVNNLNSVDDLSPDHINVAMGIEMVSIPENNHYFFTIHDHESDWYYGLIYHENPNRQTNKIVEFRFTNEDRKADMGPVCGMDFDAYVAELLRMGFVNREDMATYDTFPARALHPDPKTGEPVMDGPRSVRRPSWYFTRPGLLVRVDARAEAVEPDAKRNHACVEHISVRRYDP